MYHPANPVSIDQALPEGRPRNLRPDRRELDHRMANSLQLAADLLLFEQASQQEVGKVVDRKGRLDAVCSERALAHDEPGVVDEHVDARKRRVELGGDGAEARL